MTILIDGEHQIGNFLPGSIRDDQTWMRLAYSFIAALWHEVFANEVTEQSPLEAERFTLSSLSCCSAEAQSVEHPSKVPVWCKSTDVTSYHAVACGGRKNHRTRKNHPSCPIFGQEIS